MLTRMAPAPDFRKELREELGAQVEQGMAKSGSLLAVLVELVGMAVDNRHSEIAALIAAARQPAEGRARAERQETLGRLMQQLLARNLLALSVFPFVAAFIHAAVQLVRKYLVLSTRHRFFDQLRGPAFQHEFFSRVSRFAMDRVLPLLCDAFAPIIERALSASLLTQPTADATFALVFAEIKALSATLLQRIPSLHEGLRGLFSLEAVSATTTTTTTTSSTSSTSSFPFSSISALSPSFSSSPDAVVVDHSQLLLVETLALATGDEFLQAWRSLTADSLLYFLSDLFRSPLMASPSFKVIQLSASLREFFVQHFGPSPVENPFFALPSSGLTSRIPANNAALKLLLQHVSETISEETIILLQVKTATVTSHSLD